VTVALAQIPLSSDIASNLGTILEYIRRAAEAGADLVVFPEYALSGVPLPEVLVAPRAARLRAAVECVVECCSNVAVRCILPSLWYDAGWRSSAFVIDAGAVRLRHDKAVLSQSERELLRAGERVSVVDLDGVRFGLLLCAEGNGSELLAVQSFAGAQVIIHASAPDSLPGSTLEGDDLWTIPIAALFPVRSRVRAFGEQVWIISALPAGCGSRSKVVAPDGGVVAFAESEQAGLIPATIDPAAFPFRHHHTFARRQEVFLASCRALLPDS